MIKFSDQTKAVTILRLVQREDGLLSWYPIVIHVDTRGASQDIPTYAVLMELTDGGYLHREPDDNSNKATYHLTQKGREFLQSLTNDNSDLRK